MRIANGLCHLFRAVTKDSQLFYHDEYALLSTFEIPPIGNVGLDSRLLLFLRCTDKMLPNIPAVQQFGWRR